VIAAMPTLAALVVDDSAAMRRHVRQALAALPGFEVSEACDGADAWRQLVSARFDILLTDLNMPVLDGLKLVALVRQGTALAGLPILVITGEAAAADRQRALELGADALLAKPVEGPAVVAAVRSLLRGRAG
jgi:two-component system, chemotaxis family, chemotaxis protein CheY